MSKRWPLNIIQKIPKPRKYNGRALGEVIRDIKLDGMRVIVSPTGAYSTRVSDVTGEYERVVGWNPMERVPGGIPEGAAYDGELWVPGGHASSISTLLAEGRGNELAFEPWTVLWWQGKDLRRQSTIERRRLLRSEAWPTTMFEIDTTHHVDVEQDLADAEQHNYEGWVYKEPGGWWGEGWWKIKVTKTVDCVVTGVQRGRVGQHRDRVGALHVSVRKGDEWIEVAKIGSFTMAVREELTQVFRGVLTGLEPGLSVYFPGPQPGVAVCEVEYDCLAANGRLRFPRFKRWRHDKKEDECPYDQLA